MEWWEANKEGISELNPDTVSDIKTLVSQRHKSFVDDQQPKPKETLSKPQMEDPAARSDGPATVGKPKTTSKAAQATKEATPPPPADDDFAGMFDK